MQRSFFPFLFFWFSFLFFFFLVLQCLDKLNDSVPPLGFSVLSSFFRWLVFMMLDIKLGAFTSYTSTMFLSYYHIDLFFLIKKLTKNIH